MGGTNELHSVGILSIPYFHEYHCTSDLPSQIEFLCCLLHEMLFRGKGIA